MTHDSMVKRALVLLGIGLFLVSASPVEAQRGQGRRGPGDREGLEERIRQRMGQMMQARLGLGDDEAALLSEVVQEFEGMRRDLARQEQATRRRVEALTLERSSDGTEALELLSRMADLRAEEAALFRAEQERLLEVLTPLQVIQFHSLREELGERVRALRRGQGRLRRPGGGGEVGAAIPGGWH